jgi:signal transduction histidine kinase
VAFSIARRLGRSAWRGLAEVLVGSDPAPASRRPGWLRWPAFVVLGVATLIGYGSSVWALEWFYPLPRSVAPLLAVAHVVALPLTVRYPLLGWRISYLAALLTPLVPASQLAPTSPLDNAPPVFWPWNPIQMLVLLVAFGVAGVRHRRRVLWWMWAFMLGALWLRAGPHAADAVAGTVGFTALTIALDGATARRRARHELAAQTERTELERARRTVLQERTRLARELHDVVAHHMSLIAVQAETAPYRLGDLPAAARAEFRSVSQGAREALADMRQLLGVLRNDEQPERAPQPRLCDVADLVESARRAGVAVELSMPGAPERVPASVAVCTYRIVQESLSNARRHAPGAAVTVTVDQAADRIRLTVTNTTSPSRGSARMRNGSAPMRTTAGRETARDVTDGHGLTGMRERVALLGGSLSVGPSAGGGFVVSAVLPLTTVAQAEQEANEAS